jgi:glycine betaine/proline transport system permease protein
LINIYLFSFIDEFFEKINDYLIIGERFRTVIKWMQRHFDFIFDGIKDSLDFLVETFQDVLLMVPNIVLLILFGILAFYLSGRKIAIFTTIGLLLILTMGYWDKMLITLSMVLISTIIALLIGIPLGIYSAKSNRVNKTLRPILDFMQTMPAYVYLIPAVLFFGLGVVPGILATIIFSMPPAVRLTNLGIRQVSGDVVEAAQSFGTTGRQLLFKVQLPLAKNTILAGLNQTIMLSLSMVVISAMIGAKGLGLEVYNGITQLDIGKGFESGLSIVILAMILDRITGSLGSQKN